MVRLALIGTQDDAADVVRLVSRIAEARLAAIAVEGERSSHITDIHVSIVADTFASLLDRHSASFDAVLVLDDPRRCWADCLRAVEAGKHLLLQRCLALSPSHLSSVEAARAKSGARLMVGDSLRFEPRVQAIFKSVQSGQLGNPALVRIHSWDSVGTFSPAHLTAAIDVAIMLFGKGPCHVYSTARSKAGDSRQQTVAAAFTPDTQWGNSTRVPNNSDPAAHEFEYLQFHMTFECGGIAVIDYACTLPQGDGYSSFTLLGTRGAAHADDQSNVQLLYRGGTAAALRSELTDIAALGALKEFVSAIEEDRQPLACGADVVSALQISSAVTESFAARDRNGRGNQVNALANVM